MSYNTELADPAGSCLRANHLVSLWPLIPAMGASDWFLLGSVRSISLTRCVGNVTLILRSRNASRYVCDELLALLLL
jgi:hypothetical protein